MEHRWPATKASFIIVWGVLGWGGSVALAITLIDRHRIHNIGTPYQIVARFAIFMAAGIIFGLQLWNRSGACGRTKLTPSIGNVLRVVLFFTLMVGLAFALWVMSHY